ncbi:hypothetical protein [Burkholderia ubonensis]|uniref:hypothetical protein n=1 Tax=Burkholderia ubonensis TaxID=101571 RepID=UPI000755DC71|nr:hypothetical protein [Burkholderia ubonensis]KVG21974.1 hypothetical protein WJ29_12055 [Burkholderia ubonensis]KWK70199.1 hypothetical protein WM15_05130 [Burkholderia ubonensis]OJA68809.1 hypothetical protein BGV70_07345 [Burkholderia ubonensis]
MNPTETRESARRTADQGRRPDPSSRGHTQPARGVATESVDNGPAAAAILAGIGCFAVGLFALAGDASKAIAHFFTFYKPTGPLSGVTTSAIVIWLLSWFVLSRQWGKTSVTLGRVIFVSFVLLALGVLLTFPPIMDLLQGK